jgi:hypothetical protein
LTLYGSELIETEITNIYKKVEASLADYGKKNSP